MAALLAERRQRALELAALNEVAERLAVVRDPQDLLEEVVAQARRLLGVDLTYLALVDDDAFRIVVADGARSPRLVGIRLPAGGGLIGRVVDSGEAMWTRDYGSETRIAHEETADRAASAEGLRGLLGVPLAVRGRVLGALLAAKRQERSFDDDEIRLLSGLAAHAAVAIDNARSRQQLAESEAALQDTLRLDAALTAAVLEGGDLDSLLERVRAMTPTRLDWLDPAAAQQPHPGTVRPVVAAGDLLGALAVADAGPADRRRAADGARRARARADPGRAPGLRARRPAGPRHRHRRPADPRRGGPRGGAAPLPRRGARPAPRARGRGGRRPSRGGPAVGGRPARRHRCRGGAARASSSSSALPTGRTWTRPGGGPAPRPPGWPGRCPPTACAAPTPTPAAPPGRSPPSAVTATWRAPGDLGVFAVLLSRTGRQELADQVQRELGRVLAEERVRQVPLVDTLRTYLEQGRRPTATAAALGVHVNTLYQRLATLDRLLGEGWRSRALDLQVLLVLHRASGRLDG